jgi:hypothetical protein
MIGGIANNPNLDRLLSLRLESYENRNCEGDK